MYQNVWQNIVALKIIFLWTFFLEFCPSNPCLNEAVCFEAGDGQGYFCLCTTDFTGTNCETMGK